MKKFPEAKKGKTELMTFFKQDQSDDRENTEKIKRMAGPKAAKQFKKEDVKEDKKLVAKASKTGKSMSDIKKMDEAKDKKIMSKVMKKSKK